MENAARERNRSSTNKKEVEVRELISLQTLSRRVRTGSGKNFTEEPRRSLTRITILEEKGGEERLSHEKQWQGCEDNSAVTEGDGRGREKKGLLKGGFERKRFPRVLILKKPWGGGFKRPSEPREDFETKKEVGGHLFTLNLGNVDCARRMKKRRLRRKTFPTQQGKGNRKDGPESTASAN